jgi:predicted RNA-binding protein
MALKRLYFSTDADTVRYRAGADKNKPKQRIMTMCEQRVFLMEQGEEKLIMEAVDRMQTVPGGIRVMNLFGEEKTVAGQFYSWENNKMVLTAQDG